MHIPICEHKMTWVKKLLSLVPNNVTSNFYMLLRVPNIVIFFFFKVNINFFVPSQRICVYVYVYHIYTNNCALRA